MVLEGVNKQIADRLAEKEELTPLTYEDVDEALGSTDNNTRAIKSAALIRKAWRGYPGLGAVPAIEALLEAEQGELASESHRDHVVHTLLVYLLGLDVFFHLPKIQDALIGHPVGKGQVAEKIDKDLVGQFKKRWAVTSLGHDPGYVIRDEGRLKIPELVAAHLNNPLEDFRDRLSDISIQRIFEQCRVGQWRTEYVNELLLFNGENVLQSLTGLTKDTGLCTGDSHPLDAYYSFVRDVGCLKGDHGIWSALILLQLHRRFRLLLADFNPDVVKSALTNLEFRFLKGLPADLEMSADDIEIGCAAIALHNVRADFWDDGQINLAESTHNLRLREFCLTLSETPYAWLLAFCDALQCWHRPSTRGSVETYQYYREPSSVSIEYVEGYLWLTFKDEARQLKETAKHPFYELRLELLKVLEEEVVDTVLENPGILVSS